MSIFDSFPEPLFQVIELGLGILNLGNRRMLLLQLMMLLSQRTTSAMLMMRMSNRIPKLMHASSQARRSGILFGNAHGIAIELFGQIRTQGGTFGQCQKTNAQVVNDPRCILFLFDLRN